MKPFNIRLKLNDILEDEKLIMLALQDVSAKTTLGRIKIWYNSDVSKEQAEEFQKQWPMVEVTDRTPEYDFCWFDIIKQSDYQKYRAHGRFKFFYSTSGELLQGIFSYYNHVLNSIENSKPKKVLYKK